MKRQLYGHLALISKTIQVRRTKHTGHFSWRKDELVSDVLHWTPTHGRASVGRPARIYLRLLCEDTGCSLEDLAKGMYKKDGWREGIWEIRAVSAT